MPITQLEQEVRRLSQRAQKASRYLWIRQTETRKKKKDVQQPTGRFKGQTDYVPLKYRFQTMPVEELQQEVARMQKGVVKAQAYLRIRREAKKASRVE